LKRTKPLNTQFITGLSWVETARCGSSAPTSAAAMPTFKIFSACAVPLKTRGDAMQQRAAANT